MHLLFSLNSPFSNCLNTSAYEYQNDCKHHESPVTPTTRKPPGRSPPATGKPTVQRGRTTGTEELNGADFFITRASTLVIGPRIVTPNLMTTEMPWYTAGRYKQTSRQLGSSHQESQTVLPNGRRYFKYRMVLCEKTWENSALKVLCLGP